MLGIVQLKKLAFLVISLTEQGVEVAKDKKFKGSEIFLFIDELMLIPDVVNNWSKVEDEWKDRTDAEQAELTDYIAEEFDLPNAKAKALVVKAIKFGMLGFSLVADMRKIKQP